MSRVNALIAAIQTLLETNADLSEVKHIEEHGGRFEVDEIKRLARKTPALAISCLNILATNQGAQGDNEYKLDLVVYVITTDLPGNTRSAQGRSITEKLLRHMKDEEWGYEFAQPATDFQARNLYTSKLDKIGVSLWAVAFKQIIQLECC